MSTGSGAHPLPDSLIYHNFSGQRPCPEQQLNNCTYAAPSNLTGRSFADSVSLGQRTQSVNPRDYVLALDSRTRDCKLYPETNDITLKLHFPRGLAVTQIVLGSVELPLSQYTIEPTWANMYFDEGIRLHPTDTEEECDHTLVILDEDMTTEIHAVVPYVLNPIVAVDVSDPQSPIFTTQYRHGLETRGIWENWNSAIELIGTNYTSSSLTQLTASNPHFVMLDDYTFQLQGTGTAFIVGPSAPYGYVYSPPIANPVELANVLTAGLNYSMPGKFEVSYDCSCGTFCIKQNLLENYCVDIACSDEANNNHHDSCYPSSNSTLFQKAQVYTNYDSRCLVSLLGFICSSSGSVSFPYSQYEMYQQNYRNLSGGASYKKQYNTAASLGWEKAGGDCAGPYGTNEICAGKKYALVSNIYLTPGIYQNAGELTSEAYLQWNRFDFPRTCAASPAPPPSMVFSDGCGVCHEVTLPFGKYTPYTFAETLQDLMNTAAGTTGIYEVTFETSSSRCSGSLVGRFRFATSDGSQFALEFADANSTLTQVLSFLPLTYRNPSAVYVGNYIVIPLSADSSTASVCTHGGSETFLHNSILPFVNSTTRTIGFQVRTTRPLSSSAGDFTIVYNALDNHLEVDTSATPIAHGYQVGDVVTLVTDGLVYSSTVVEVPSAFSFVLEGGSLPGATIADGGAVCIASKSDNGIVNLYFFCCGDRKQPLTKVNDGNSFCCNPQSYLQQVVSAGVPFPQVFCNFTNSILPDILGFPPCVVLWKNATDSLPILAPRQYSVDHPDYLLIEITVPTQQSNYIYHKSGKSVKTNIFAKIVLYPQYRLERMYPMQSIFPSTTLLDEMHIRFLNPNHEPYQFHGKNWSMTLVCLVLTNSVQQLCL